MTGKPFAPLGAVTERTWQSSLIARPSTTGPVTQSNRDGSCGQTGPRVVVSRTSSHGAMGCGAAKRAARA